MQMTIDVMFLCSLGLHTEPNSHCSWDVRSMCFDGPVFPLYDFEHGSHKASPFWCSQIYDSCLSLKTS
jgi:hypothetical protein